MLDAPTITAISGLIVAITALVKIFEAERQRTAQTEVLQDTHQQVASSAATLQQIGKDTNGNLTRLHQELSAAQAQRATPEELAARVASSTPPHPSS